MSIHKSSENSIESVDEDEEEHIKLLRNQEEYEKQLINEMPHLDDNEYSRMIEISENLRRGDVNMENIEINNDEEEKTPQDKSVGIRGKHQKVSKNEDEDKYNDSQRSFFDSNTNPSKDQTFPTSSFLKRTAFTKDSESSSKYQTPQSYLNAYSFGKTSSPSRKDKNEEF